MYKSIFDELNVDDKLFKKPKIKKFDTVKSNIPLIADYNYMADLLILPRTKEGFNGLLVMVDLATDELDFEPYKTKEPAEILKCMKKIFSRPYLKKPYASIKTDSGTEFKGVFHKYLYDNSILHKLSLPDRHRQMANVESANKQIGKVIMTYLNAQDLINNMSNTDWTHILPRLRVKLNEFRKKEITDTPFCDLRNVPLHSISPPFIDKSTTVSSTHCIDGTFVRLILW